jgi:hypothetical protein
VATKETSIEQANRRTPEPETEPDSPEQQPRVAQVREEDLEPHAGLRYIARLFKVLALLLLFMLIAEIAIGFRQEGTAAIGTLLIEATRLIVFAGFLWGAGDIALMLIESNHDLRATRILLGRMGARLERLVELQSRDTTITPEPPRAP